MQRRCASVRCGKNVKNCGVEEKEIRSKRQDEDLRSKVPQHFRRVRRNRCGQNSGSCDGDDSGC